MEFTRFTTTSDEHVIIGVNHVVSALETKAIIDLGNGDEEYIYYKITDSNNNTYDIAKESFDEVFKEKL